VSLGEDIRQLKTDARTLRKFGLLVGGVFVALGLWFWLRHRPVFPYLLALGVALLLLGAVVPGALKPVYQAWMTLALVLGFVVSHVLLTLFFILVITPVGWLARASGKDFLGLKSDRNATTWWVRRDRPASSKSGYERQY
jgi:hypothetical protein